VSNINITGCLNIQTACLDEARGMPAGLLLRCENCGEQGTILRVDAFNQRNDKYGQGYLRTVCDDCAEYEFYDD